MGRTGQFLDGHPGNPGRSHAPRMAVTRALRRLQDPEAIARFLLETINDPSAPLRDRITCAGLVIDRTEGRAPQSIAITATSAQLPPGWAELSAAERIRYIDAISHEPLTEEGE